MNTRKQFSHRIDMRDGDGGWSSTLLALKIIRFSSNQQYKFLRPIAVQSPNQWLRVLINQNASIANHTSAKMPASRISRRVSGAPEAFAAQVNSNAEYELTLRR